MNVLCVVCFKNWSGYCFVFYLFVNLCITFKEPRTRMFFIDCFVSECLACVFTYVFSYMICCGFAMCLPPFWRFLLFVLLLFLTSLVSFFASRLCVCVVTFYVLHVFFMFSAFPSVSICVCIQFII